MESVIGALKCLTTFVEVTDVIECMTFGTFKNIQQCPHLPVDFTPCEIEVHSSIYDEFFHIETCITLMFLILCFRAYEELALIQFTMTIYLMTMLTFEQEVVVVGMNI